MHGSTLQEVARAARHVAGYDELIHAARKACAGRLMYELNESFTRRTGTLYLQGTFGVRLEIQARPREASPRPQHPSPRPRRPSPRPREASGGVAIVPPHELSGNFTG